jgi:hypothetical protein
MPITSITTDITGEASVHPRLVRIVSTDNYNAVTTLNYLQSAEALGFTFYPTDAALVIHSNGLNLFKVDIDSTGIQLVLPYND